jgi:hypothetical protein
VIGILARGEHFCHDTGVAIVVGVMLLVVIVALSFEIRNRIGRRNVIGSSS